MLSRCCRTWRPCRTTAPASLTWPALRMRTWTPRTSRNCVGSSLSLYRGNFRYLHNLLYVGRLDRPTAAGIVLYRELCFIDVPFGLPHRQAYPSCLLAFFKSQVSASHGQGSSSVLCFSSLLDCRTASGKRRLWCAPFLTRTRASASTGRPR